MAMTANPYQMADAIADAYKTEQTRIVMTLSAVMQRVETEDDMDIEEQAAIEYMVDMLVGEMDKVTEDYIDHILQRWVDE